MWFNPHHKHPLQSNPILHIFQDAAQFKAVNCYPAGAAENQACLAIGLSTRWPVGAHFGAAVLCSLRSGQL